MENEREGGRGGGAGQSEEQPQLELPDIFKGLSENQMQIINQRSTLSYFKSTIGGQLDIYQR